MPKENSIEFPAFEHIRGKTKIPCYAHLTPECMEALELWFRVRDKNSRYVFPNGNGDKDQPIRNETLNDIIKRLVQGAGITPTGQIKFHCVGRKFLMNAGSKIGLNEFQLKFLVAKAISVSDETYLLLKQQIDEKFPQLYEHIRLNGQLQRRLGEQGQLEARIVELESRIEEMTRKFEQASEWRKDVNYTIEKQKKAFDDLLGLSRKIKELEQKVAQTITEAFEQQSFIFFDLIAPILEAKTEEERRKAMQHADEYIRGLVKALRKKGEIKEINS